jgi:Asp-tRNA(Asn)/Glu-tRNA(Gln) amidotransferase A subunit family amidase
MTNISTAVALLREGKVTPMDLLGRCLERIDRLEDRVRAWVLVDRPRARAEAEARAGELRRGYDRGPLHGIPIGIKDIFDVFDWPTACGSRLWKNSVARHDAAVVQRLRQAGAVLIGKTVTTQYASFDPAPTRNPWNPARTPGGSSSGSSAAVACGMCFGALGSQTGGSITRPAGYCGVSSCKPTYGAAPVAGVLPLAESMDHPGPMAGCIRDVELLTRTICTSRIGDGNPLAVPASPPVIGRPRGFFDRYASESVRAMMDRVCVDLVQRGAIIEDVSLPPAFEEVVARHRVVMAVEAALYHQERFRRHPEDYDPKITSLLEEGIACPAPEYARCKQHQKELRKEMSCFADWLSAKSRARLGQGRLCLICPATTMPAPDAATTGDPAFNSPWSYTGLPAVSFPVGFSPERLPLSVQLIGEAFAEEELFRAAAWCENALGFTIGDPPV